MKSKTSCGRVVNTFSLKALIQANFSTGIARPVEDRLRPVAEKGAKTAIPVAVHLRGQLVSPSESKSPAQKVGMTGEGQSSSVIELGNKSPSRLNAPSNLWPYLHQLNEQGFFLEPVDGRGLVLHHDAPLPEEFKAHMAAWVRARFRVLGREMGGCRGMKLPVAVEVACRNMDNAFLPDERIFHFSPQNMKSLSRQGKGPKRDENPVSGPYRGHEDLMSGNPPCVEVTP